MIANKTPIAFEDDAGYKYDFYEYSFDNLPDLSSCIYIYAAKNLSGYRPVYIGMTTRSIRERHGEHENKGDTFDYGFHGATCLLVHTRPEVIPWTKWQLEDIEAALISRYQPVCNERG